VGSIDTLPSEASRVRSDPGELHQMSRADGCVDGPPDFRQFIDRVVVPALLQRFLGEHGIESAGQSDERLDLPKPARPHVG
jgi:hypothetical protein